MDCLKTRRKQIDLVEAFLCPFDSRVAMVGLSLSGRTGIIDLPGKWRPIRRVLGEKTVKERRASSRQTENEKWPTNDFVSQFRMFRTVVGELKSMREKLD